MSESELRAITRKLDQTCREMVGRLKIPAPDAPPPVAPAAGLQEGKARPTLHLVRSTDDTTPRSGSGQTPPGAQAEARLWIPAIAGAVAVVHETDPNVLHGDMVPVSSLLVSMASIVEGEPMDVVVENAIYQLALDGLPRLQEWFPQTLLPGIAGLPANATHDQRLEQAERWMTEEAAALPLPWVALSLGCSVPAGRPRFKDFLEERRPYAGLAEHFRALADGRNVRDWRAMLWTATEYWRETRGRLTLRLVLPKRAATKEAHPLERPATTPSAPAAPALLEKLERQLAEARRELREVRDQAATRQRALGSAQQQILEAKQSRDRAVARSQRLALELAEAREFIRAPKAERVAPPTPVTTPVEAPAAVAPTPPPVQPEQVFQGRSVYLFTGMERTGARRQLSQALERLGATCQVYDGNRQPLLGPARFDPAALVVIDTRMLSHSATEAIVARAEASGVWYFRGPAGRRSLMRVVEAWGRKH